MSVSMNKGEGVTVFTLKFDPKSPCPPLCQILKTLCYSPVCFTVSEHLRTVSQSVLGALDILIGCLNIGFGLVLLNSGSGSGWQMDDNAFPVWMGVLFILFGMMCIISEKFPSLCLVSLNVILNMTGVAFAITAIILYSINMADMDISWMCSDDYYGNRHSGKIPTMSSEQKDILQRCTAGQNLSLMLLRSINGALIILSALELCLTISSVVLGIKALKKREKIENEINRDPEQCKSLLTTN